jgi:glycosyltransferase involved in cell wall biosynthesis
MRKNIALCIYGIEKLSGGGGSERFWADFFRLYKGFKDRKYNIYLFCDKKSYDELVRVNRLNNKINIVLLKNFSNRFKYILEFYDLIIKLFFFRISILHVAEYNTVYYHRLFKLTKIPKFLRPKVSVTIANCMVPYFYDSDITFKKPINQLLKEIKLDGILSWYDNVKQFFLLNGFNYENPHIYSVKYCFTDLSHFKSSSKKEKVIVFAARLSQQKRPLLFLDAIAKLQLESPELVAGWKFMLYGKGYLLEEVISRIIELKLSSIVSVEFSVHMADVFSKSMCFVSTQDYENFTSLSMLEAMACGNVIVSRNVGQTSYFARNGVNAFLAIDDSIEAISDALKQFFLLNESKFAEMSKESIRIASMEHNFENFTSELESFFENVRSKN